MAEPSAFCSFCGGGKPCSCGACEKNTGPESFGGPDRYAGPAKGTGTHTLVTPAWSEEVYNFLKTSLQEIRGSTLTDNTMSISETRQLETLLCLTPHPVHGTFHLNCHVLFITSRHHISHSKKMNMKGHY
jgi:hypothetical protein